MCGAKDCINKFRAQFGRYPEYISVNCECTIKTYMLKGNRKCFHAYIKQREVSDQNNHANVSYDCTVKTYMLKGIRRRTHVYQKLEMQWPASDQHEYDS